MADKERLNRSSGLRRVRTNVSELRNSRRTFEDIFRISFAKDDYSFLYQMTCGDYNSVTYGMAKKYIYSFANHFNNNIAKDSKYVGLLLENSPEWIYTFYGLMMAGFVPVLLSTRISTKNLEDICEKIGISAVISDKTPFGNYKFINPFEIDKNENQIELKGQFADEIVFLTSGTSGVQKLVFYSGKELSEQIFHAQQIAEENKAITKFDKGYLRHLVVLPFYHIFGLVAVLMWFSFFNCAFIIPVNLTPSAITQACAIARPTHIFAVPLFWSTITGEIKKYVNSTGMTKKFNKGINISVKLQRNFGKLGFFFARKIMFSKYLDNILGKSIKFCITGGSFIDEETMTTINAIGYPLANGYGSTEIGITSLSKCDSFKTRIQRSIGMPFDGITYETHLNENGISELVVSGKSIAKKIIDKDKVYENFDHVNTYDAVYLKNKAYYIDGRVDDIIVLKNGENYSLAILESLVSTKYALDHTVIFDDESKSFVLLLSYDKKITDFQIAQEKELIKAQKLSSEISKVLYTFYKFPKANEIKLMRYEVNNYYKNHKDEFFDIEKIASISTNDADINDEILSAVIDIFKKNFNGAEIKKDADFYGDLGGDSLKYMVILGELSDRFNIEFSTVDSVPKTPQDFAAEIMRLLKWNGSLKN